MSSRRKVLVTGGSGFVGRQILAYLRCHDVELFTLSRRPQRLEGVHVITADLLSRRTVDAVIGKIKPDVVLHNAWYVRHGEFWHSRVNLDWVAATMTLTRACIEHSVKRLVGVGTCYEYQWPESAVCDEVSTPTAGHVLYDRSKSAVRDLLSTALVGTDVSFAWGRLFFLYGPYEAPQRLVADVARSLVASKPARCSSGSAVRDFMDVRDAGAALAALALSDVVGDVNIATGKPVKISEVVRLLGNISGKPELVEIGAILDRPEPPYIVGANVRLEREVGFTPKIDLASGLENALSFWQSHSPSSAPP